MRMFVCVCVCVNMCTNVILFNKIALASPGLLFILLLLYEMKLFPRALQTMTSWSVMFPCVLVNGLISLSTPMGVDYVIIGFDMEVQPLVTQNEA